MDVFFNHDSPRLRQSGGGGGDPAMESPRVDLEMDPMRPPPQLPIGMPALPPEEELEALPMGEVIVAVPPGRQRRSSDDI